jgi:uncharacterized hydrophobic protein (TIGR00271 family)
MRLIVTGEAPHGHTTMYTIWAERAMARRTNVSEELLTRIEQEGRLTTSFLVLMGVSGTLTAIALLTNSVPVLIGAMVVAPVFAPLALSVFSLAGGNPKLAARGLGTAGYGLAVAIGSAMLVTWLMQAAGIVPAQIPFEDRPLLDERVRPGWYSALSALAAGVAGAVGIVKNRTDTLIGTVAAVALVPAGTAAGIALLAGESLRATGGVALLAVNIGLIVGVGLLTVAVMRPGREN